MLFVAIEVVAYQDRELATGSENGGAVPKKLSASELRQMWADHKGSAR